MTRLTLALTVTLCVLPAAPASTGPRPDSPLAGKDVLPKKWMEPPPAAEPAAPKAEEGKTQLVITDQTDIKLDGQPCQLKDVPKSAVVELIDFSSDKKTIQKLYFRSK
jgi:hypothetical protein